MSKPRILTAIFTHERPLELLITLEAIAEILKYDKEGYFSNKKYIILDSSEQENAAVKLGTNQKLVSYIHLPGLTLPEKISRLAGLIDKNKYDFVDFCPDQDILLRQVDYSNIDANHHLGFSLGWRLLKTQEKERKNSNYWIFLKNNTLRHTTIKAPGSRVEELQKQIKAFSSHSAGELWWGLRNIKSAMIFIELMSELSNVVPKEMDKVIECCCNIYYSYCTYAFCKSSIFIRDYEQSKSLSNSQEEFKYMKNSSFLKCLGMLDKYSSIKVATLNALRNAISSQLKENNYPLLLLPSQSELYEKLLINAKGYYNAIAKDFVSDTYCIPLEEASTAFQGENKITTYMGSSSKIGEMAVEQLPLLLKRPIDTEPFEVLNSNSPFSNRKIAAAINNVPNKYWMKHIKAS